MSTNNDSVSFLFPVGDIERLQRIEACAIDLEKVMVQLIGAGEITLAGTYIGAQAITDRLQALHKAIEAKQDD